MRSAESDAGAATDRYEIGDQISRRSQLPYGDDLMS